MRRRARGAAIPRRPDVSRRVPRAKRPFRQQFAGRCATAAFHSGGDAGGVKRLTRERTRCSMRKRRDNIATLSPSPFEDPRYSRRAPARVPGGAAKDAVAPTPAVYDAEEQRRANHAVKTRSPANRCCSPPRPFATANSVPKRLMSPRSWRYDRRVHAEAKSEAQPARAYLPSSHQRHVMSASKQRARVIRVQFTAVNGSASPARRLIPCV